MFHHCQNLLIHCLDFRLLRAINNYMERESLLGNCDLVSVAGAGRDLLADDPTVWKQVELSHQLHQIERVILLHHTDCGAYGGRAAFANTAEECAKQTEDMKAAADKITARFPDLTVKLVLAKISEGGEISFENLT